MNQNKEYIFNFVEGEMLLIDKPLEWTSFDVVKSLRIFLKKTYNLKKLKVGHAGTLDPLATGLLILCTGKMTKQIDSFQGMDKVYIGQMTLGATTASFDKETKADQLFPIDKHHIDDLNQASLKFKGEIEQVPPVYSAIKVDGKRAYKSARKDKDVKMKSRKVTVHEFDLLNFTPPHLNFSVKCSKGTYIRSIILAITLGGFVWGLTGMFIAVPFVAALRVLGDNIDELAPLGYLLGKGGTEEHSVNVARYARFFKLSEIRARKTLRRMRKK